MSRLFLFDDIVNYIMADTINDWIANEENQKTLCQSLNEFQLFELHAISRERGNNVFLHDYKLHGYGHISYHYILLYNKDCPPNVRMNILNKLEYGSHILDTFETYHLIKNKFYEAIEAKLEKKILITGDPRIDNKPSYDMSDLMTVAAKNNDIRCLKIFLEKGFLIHKRHRQYLRTACGDYYHEQIVPLLTDARKKVEQNHE